MINIEQNTPEAPRSAVKFKDGKFGVVITAEKARSDAEVLRWIVAQIEKGARVQPNDLQRAVGSLNSLALQYDMAAAGNDPKAP